MTRFWNPTGSVCGPADDRRGRPANWQGDLVDPLLRAHRAHPRTGTGQRPPPLSPRGLADPRGHRYRAACRAVTGGDPAAPGGIARRPGSGRATQASRRAQAPRRARPHPAGSARPPLARGRRLHLPVPGRLPAVRRPRSASRPRHRRHHHLSQSHHQARQGLRPKTWPCIPWRDPGSIG
jgi:hypothetical protein